MYAKLKDVRNKGQLDHLKLQPLHGVEKVKEGYLRNAIDQAIDRLIECLWKGHTKAFIWVQATHFEVVRNKMVAAVAPGTVVNLLLGDHAAAGVFSNNYSVAPHPGILGSCEDCDEMFGLYATEIAHENVRAWVGYYQPGTALTVKDIEQAMDFLKERGSVSFSTQHKI